MRLNKGCMFRTDRDGTRTEVLKSAETHAVVVRAVREANLQNRFIV